ncbi:PhoPQ-activated pathogenicity-related family protein [Thermostilla marina]
MSVRRLVTMGFVVMCIFVLGASVSLAGALEDYVRRPDDSFAWKHVASIEHHECRVHALRLTSQTWRGIEWKHWLYLIVPPNRTVNDGAVLFITGGSSKDTDPLTGAKDVDRFVPIAKGVGVPVAILRQVPNQPLFDGLYEDDIISLTFANYLRDGDTDWPLLLPMVKSAVAAMDAVQACAQAKENATIERFLVTGASKRGWTTWLTAAVDDRVCGIAPMVIDVLNMPAQMKRQLASYGEYSRQIMPYTKRGIQDAMQTAAGERLTAIVDPFTYRDRYTMPKLVLLGTNDPYWTVDAAWEYFPSVPGPKVLFYLPNAGHGLGGGIVPTFTAFVDAVFSGKTLPEVTTRLEDDNRRLIVEWTGERPTGAVLWSAESDTRDFRESRWNATNVPIENGRCVVVLETPRKGYRAAFVELRFEGRTGSYALSSLMSVVPAAFPYRVETGEDGKPRIVPDNRLR